MSFNLGYDFQNPKLLETALTHRSYLNEHRQEDLDSNERLEFLGDAVLELIISDYLFKKYPDFPEGKLTLLRSRIVQTKTLALAAGRLGVGERLKLSKGEKESKGQNNPSILADTFEAVIGAIYQDSGFKPASRFVKKNLIDPWQKKFSAQLPKDYKSELQETVQADGYPSPVYRVVEARGPDHQKTFTVAVWLENQKYGAGQGSSKQQAEQQAAKKALAKFAKKAKEGYN